MGYIYFFRVSEPNGFLSNWYESKMIIDGIEYISVEQYMMHQKAILFGDTYIAERILNTRIQRDIKALGRKVKGFNSKVWDDKKYDIVSKGIHHKFESNPELKKKFLESPRDSVFVECSPYDRVWGVGLSVFNEGIDDPSKWRGSNLLGKVIGDVRKLYQ